MSDSGEIQFACIGCGAMNPAGAEVCAGCGHRFAGPDILASPRPTDPVEGPTPRPRLAPVRNPYEPPSTPVSPPTSFRIGTGLAFIAVVAVCLAAFRADINLGIFASVMFMPAAIRTPLVAARRRSESRPMGVGEQIGSFLMTVLATTAISLSTMVGFVATCLPTGIATGDIRAGLTVGAFGAIACAVMITKFFLRMARETAAREREIRYW